jgi:hypothetical protein
MITINLNKKSEISQVLKPVNSANMKRLQRNSYRKYGYVNLLSVGINTLKYILFGK